MYMNKNPPSGFFYEIRAKVAVRTRLRRLKARIKALMGIRDPITYSQFGEDLIISDLFNKLSIDRVSYLDIGANNPSFVSNTYLFYERGFRGVLVEPNPIL